MTTRIGDLALTQIPTQPSASDRLYSLSCHTLPVLLDLSQRRMFVAKKSAKHEIDHRIDVIARMIVDAATTSQIIRYCAVEWGVGQRQAETYLARAREIVRQDYSQERSDFLASRLGILDRVIQASIKSGQHSNAIGATRLQAELAQLLK